MTIFSIEQLKESPEGMIWQNYALPSCLLIALCALPIAYCQLLFALCALRRNRQSSLPKKGGGLSNFNM
jgi:hypothetical protein